MVRVPILSVLALPFQTVRARVKFGSARVKFGTGKVVYTAKFILAEPLFLVKCLELSTKLVAGIYSEFYIGKTKRRLHDRKTEHFKALTKSDQASAIADHMKTTDHNIKWDHFDILASGKTDFHCKIKETLLIQELQPSLNVNVSRSCCSFSYSFSG